MPHIHTDSGQHDITTSAWIFRIIGDTPIVLVHMHRKHGKLMQIGGHIEIDETPWQTVAHELVEESGYELSDLHIIQPYETIPVVEDAIVHPVPVISNTYRINKDHYHSDYGYAFIASDLPKHLPAQGESQDLRWLSLDELQQSVNDGIAWQDVIDIYKTIADKYLLTYQRFDADLFSVEKPEVLK